MFICLPVFSFIFSTLFYRNKFSFLGWRAAYILAAVTLTFLAMIFIEIATLFKGVTSTSVCGFWLALTFLSAGLLLWSDTKEFLKLCIVPKLEIFEFVSIAGIFLIFFINAKIAFSFPPNTWDSMTYHLPRVMHWAANASVHFYPTDIDRQLFFLPGAEFCLLHCFLLTGDDRWFNFLQWISLAGCVLSTSLIAGFLGATIRGQILTALVVATIPMAVLQSTSTQNDLFVSFWIVSFVALVLLLQRQFSRIIFYTAAMALGLTILAKGTFFVAFPFVLYFLIILCKKEFKYVFLSFGIVLILMAGHCSRTWGWQNGHSLIGNEKSVIMMKRHDPTAILVNTTAQIASELMLPWATVNRAIEKFVKSETTFLGVEANDQNIFEREFFRPSSNLVFDEDWASNPLHMVLIFVVLLFLWRLRPKKEVWLYYISVIASCFLFVFIVKWSPFISRYHVSLFILFSPLVGMMLEAWKKGAIILISILLFGVAVSVIIFHETRPISEVNNPHNLPRSAYYFMKKPSNFISYQYASKEILSSGCRDVSLLQGSDSWEYPFWALTGYGAVRFHSLNLDSFEGILLCMVVTVDVPLDKTIVLGGEIYKLVWQEPPLQIYKRSH